MKLSFHGADQGVTGSCHLLECAGLKVLVDCGMYQGGHEIAEENARPFGFDPAEIDFLLLTHAHLDHCGRIPLLVREGFKGEIITTGASRDLAKLVLLDSAHLQEEEARRASRWAARWGVRPSKPLYTVADALWAMDFFGRRAAYGKPIQLGRGLQVRFIDAGHILGSAALVLELNERGKQRTVVFSGDLGNKGRPLLRAPTPPPKADYVVMETTYGDRRHKDLRHSVEELYTAVLDTLGRGGNVIIPTFALERAQELLYWLRKGVVDDRLPRHLPVFLDSPMAISATEIFRRHPEGFDARTHAELLHGEDPFAVPELRFTRETAESMALNNIEGGAVIMAGSGMCTGGRVRHHLKHHLWRRQSSIVFVGYAAAGTLARIIIDGADEVKLFGQPVKVRAKIYTIGGFSAHADRDELLAWHHHTGHPRTTFLVHGDAGRGMARMADLLMGQGLNVLRPRLHEAVKLK